MTRENIFETINQILREKLSVKADVTEETALLGDDILDSMEFMKYLTIVEEEFNVTISDEDLEARKLGIVKNMIEYLASNND